MKSEAMEVSRSQDKTTSDEQELTRRQIHEHLLENYEALYDHASQAEVHIADLHSRLFNIEEV